MNKPASEIDEQLQATDRVSLVIAIESSQGKRNACLILGVLALAFTLFLGWNRWILLVPATLVLGAMLYQANILIVSSELKRRS